MVLYSRQATPIYFTGKKGHDSIGEKQTDQGPRQEQLKVGEEYNSQVVAETRLYSTTDSSSRSRPFHYFKEEGNAAQNVANRQAVLTYDAVILGRGSAVQSKTVAECL